MSSPSGVPPLRAANVPLPPPEGEAGASADGSLPAVDVPLLRQDDEAETHVDELPPPVLGALLKVPGLAKPYSDELLYRYRRTMLALEESERLAALRERHDQQLRECIGAMAAAQSWAGVVALLAQRLGAGVIYVGAAAAATMLPWEISGRPAVYAVLAVAALVAVHVLLVVWFHLLRRRDPNVAERYYTLVARLLLLTGVGMLVSNGLAALPLTVVGVLLLVVGHLWAIPPNLTTDLDETDARINLFVQLATVAAFAVLPRIWFDPEQVSWGLALGLLGALVGYVVLTVLALLVLDLLETARKRIGIVVFLALASVELIVSRWSTTQSGAVIDVLQAAVVPATAVLLLLVVVNLFSSSLRVAVWRWKQGWNPQADVVDTLLHALLVLEYGPSYETIDVRQPQDKQLEQLRAMRAKLAPHDPLVIRNVISELDYLAGLVHHHLTVALARMAPRVADRVRRKLRGIEAALHEWMYHLTMDGSRARAMVEPALVKALRGALRGEWESGFPRVQTDEDPETRRSRLAALWAVVRSLTAASVPLGAALVLTAANIKVPSVALGSLYTFGVTLLAVVVLRLIDPKGGDNVDIAVKGFEKFRASK